MESNILCPCGHHAGHHTAAGCNGGRYRPCPCPLGPQNISPAGTEPAQGAPPRRREPALTTTR
jgi:hypothetical protein